MPPESEPVATLEALFRAAWAEECDPSVLVDYLLEHPTEGEQTAAVEVGGTTVFLRVEYKGSRKRKWYLRVGYADGGDFWKRCDGAFLAAKGRRWVARKIGWCKRRTAGEKEWWKGS